MNYKIKGALKRNRGNFIIFLILWLFIVIVLVGPISYSWNLAVANGTFDMGIFFEKIGSSVQNPFNTIGKIISENYIVSYLKTLGGVSLLYAFCFIVGLIKTAPKDEYSDIEHGSRDWSERGEQYKILSNKKGIILAENNYLPVDKRGNVNVLVVGRFRFW